MNIFSNKINYNPKKITKNKLMKTKHFNKYMIGGNLTLEKKAGLETEINQDPQINGDLTLTIESYLDSGGSGDVYLATNKIDEKIVVKEIPHVTDITYVEIDALNGLKGLKNVVGTPVGYPTDINIMNGDKIKRKYIFMEYVGGSDLQDYVRKAVKLNENEAKLYIYQILMGIKEIHDRGWAHRDIKLENIVKDKGKYRCKLVDLGLAVNITEPNEDYNCSDIKGTSHYAAPELVTERYLSDGSSFDCKKADIFAAGVCLYIMLYGQFLFTNRTNHGLENEDKSNILNPTHNSPLFSKSGGVSNEIKGLIRKMIDVDANDRPLYVDVDDRPLDVYVDDRPSAADCLNHPALSVVKNIMGENADISVTPTDLDNFVQLREKLGMDKNSGKEDVVSKLQIYTGQRYTGQDDYDYFLADPSLLDNHIMLREKLGMDKNSSKDKVISELQRYTGQDDYDYFLVKPSLLDNHIMLRIKLGMDKNSGKDKVISELQIYTGQDDYDVFLADPSLLDNHGRLRSMQLGIDIFSSKEDVVSKLQSYTGQDDYDYFLAKPSLLDNHGHLRGKLKLNSHDDLSKVTEITSFDKDDLNKILGDVYLLNQLPTYILYKNIIKTDIIEPVANEAYIGYTDRLKKIYLDNKINIYGDDGTIKEDRDELIYKIEQYINLKRMVNMVGVVDESKMTVVHNTIDKTGILKEQYSTFEDKINAYSNYLTNLQNFFKEQNSGFLYHEILRNKFEKMLIKGHVKILYEKIKSFSGSRMCTSQVCTQLPPLNKVYTIENIDFAPSGPGPPIDKIDKFYKKPSGIEFEGKKISPHVFMGWFVSEYLEKGGGYDKNKYIKKKYSKKRCKKKYSKKRYKKKYSKKKYTKKRYKKRYTKKRYKKRYTKRNTLKEIFNN